MAKKAETRACVVQLHQMSMQIAEQCIADLNLAERETKRGNDAIFDKWAKRLKSYPKRGWFKVARGFVECGKDRQVHATRQIGEVRRAFGLLALGLGHLGRKAGHDVRHAKDVETLLLELDLALPYVGIGGGIEAVPTSFELLRSAQDLGINELGPKTPKPNRRSLTSRETRQEKLLARGRRPIVALAFLIRKILCHYVQEALQRANAVRVAAKVAAPSERAVQVQPDASFVPDERPPAEARAAHNRLGEEELKKRKELYIRLRTIQAVAIRNGKRVKDRDAWSQCKIDECDFHCLRRNAKTRGWPDPRDDAERERRLCGGR